MKWRNKGKEFDEVAIIICNNKNKYYLWGAGVFGVSFFDNFKNKINILGFIDSDVQKQAKLIRNKSVNSPEFLREQMDQDDSIKVIVTNGWIKDCFGKLNDWGKFLNIDYFHVNDFMSIYMFYMENKVYTISANIGVTSKCTLKCEKCMGLIPYVKNPQNVELEEIKLELKQYFQWVDCLGVLGIGGGDVLLNPRLTDIIKYIAEEYLENGKIEDLELYTNAIIMPNEDLLELCQKYNIIIRFSDYSKEVPKRQKIQELIELLEARQIRYDHVKWDNWYDIGFPQESNGLITDEDLQRHYEKCITKLCTAIYKGKLYFCSVHAGAVGAGYCEAYKEDSFNLAEYNPDRRKEFIEFNAGYCEKGYLNFCKRCNGYQNINTSYVPVGRQIRGGIC